MSRSKKEAYRCIMGNLRAFVQEKCSEHTTLNWGVTKWCVWWYVRRTSLDDVNVTLSELRGMRRHYRKYPQNYRKVLPLLFSTGNAMGLLVCAALAIVLEMVCQYGIYAIIRPDVVLWAILSGATVIASAGFYLTILGSWDRLIRMSAPYRILETWL